MIAKMHSYSAYNLCIHSDIPLPGLPPGGLTPDVTIRLEELDGEDLMRGPRGGMRVTNRLYYEPLDSDVLFSIEEGRSITLHPLKPIEPEVLQGWLVGVFMSVLLRQHGHLVMHGSAVAKGGRAVGFLGGSGWGKSTLAEFLCQHGHHFLTDDVLVLQMEEEQPRPQVLPGHKYIRLHAHSGGELVEKFDELVPVSSYTTKRVRFVERGTEDPFPLQKLYVLDNSPAEVNAVEPLTRQEAMLHLIAHTRSKDLLTDASFQSAHLAQCARLLQQVPVARLRRVRDLEALPDLMNTIEEDLSALSHGTSTFRSMG